MTLDNYKHYYGEKRGEQMYNRMQKVVARISRSSDDDYVAFVLGVPYNEYAKYKMR